MSCYGQQRGGRGVKQLYSKETWHKTQTIMKQQTISTLHVGQQGSEVSHNDCHVELEFASGWLDCMVAYTALIRPSQPGAASVASWLSSCLISTACCGFESLLSSSFFIGKRDAQVCCIYCSDLIRSSSSHALARVVVYSSLSPS